MKLTKKLLPLAGIACVTAAAVPAIASCSCGNKEGTFEVVEKEVLGALTIFGDNKETLAVYGVTLSKDLKEGENLKVEDVKIDSKTMKANGSADVQLYPGDSKYAYVQIPLKKDTALVDADNATIDFTLSSTDGTIKTTTFTGLTFTISAKTTGEDRVDVDIADKSGAASQIANFAATCENGSKNVTVGGLNLIKGTSLSDAQPTTFDGTIYLANELQADYSLDTTKHIKSEAWAKMEAIETTVAGKKTSLQFPAALVDLTMGAEPLTFTKSYATKSGAIKILFVPADAKHCPYYTTFNLGTTEYFSSLNITVSNPAK